jgi:hypothetical protein
MFWWADVSRKGKFQVSRASTKLRNLLVWRRVQMLYYDIYLKVNYRTYVFTEYEIHTHYQIHYEFVRLKKLDLLKICLSVTTNRTVCQYTNSVAG